jgi:RimJ/RimL family protein N-acetyltransferase
VILTRNAIILERFSREDLPLYVQAVNKPQINDGALFDGVISEEIATHWFDKYASPEKCGRDHFFSLYREGREYLGTVWLWNSAGRMPGHELSVLLADPKFFGQGIGTTACSLAVDFCFTYTDSRRIWLTVGTANTHAYKAYRKCGFQDEGVIRQFVIRGKDKIDANLMAILRDDWLELQSVE